MLKLTNPQLNIWNTQQFFKDTSVCNIYGPGLIKEQVDVELLKKAIVRLVKENDNFKIHLTLKNGEPMQYVKEDMDYDVDDIPVIDLPSMDSLAAYENDFAKEPFSLLDSPLFKFTIPRLPNGYAVVSIKAHHIIMDSWAMGIVAQETVKIYHSLVNGTEYVSDTVSYVDYILAEQAYLSSKNFVKDSEFWKDYLKNPPIPTSLPSLSSNFIDSPDGSRLTFYFDKQMMKRLGDFCSRFKVSNYVFLMSVISLFLANASNTDDVLIGTPILNRSNFKEKRSIGMFVSTVPFRAKVDSDMKFADFLDINRSNLTSILRHQRYPYSQLIDDLSSENNSLNHLYNIAVSYQITKAVSRDIGDYETEWIFPGACMNDLSIHFSDLNDSGILKIYYDFVNCKYSCDDITAWHNRLCFMIEQILDNPDILLKDVQFVANEERLVLTENFQPDFLDCPFDSNIIELFEEQVNRHPNNIACVYEDVHLTYAELDENSNQMANYLRSLGVKQNDIVGVCMHKNQFFIISVLAILKLGSAYLPMSFDFPKDRIKYILVDSHAKVLLTDQAFCFDTIRYLTVLNINKLSLDGVSSKFDYVPIPSNRLCYVIYTSGSTGKPKGVMLTHHNLINFLFAFSDCFKDGFSEKDVCLSSTNIAFDVSVCEIFTPLCFGGTLVLYPQNVLTDIPLLCDILEKEAVTFLYIPPNILNDIYDYVYSHSSELSLNKILVGVEAIKKADLKKYFNFNENMEIVNGYGPTETTICSTFYPFTRDEDNLGIVPIGFPVKNNLALVTNRFGNIMPIGYSGELCISGENVSKGYLHNIDMNEKSYILLPRFWLIFVL